MKCVCGYIHGKEWIVPEGKGEFDSELVEFNSNGQEFIQIEGNFTIQKDYNIEKANLYACPECGTIKYQRF